MQEEIEPYRVEIRDLKAQLKEKASDWQLNEGKIREGIKKTKDELIHLSEENVTLWANYNKLKADYAEHMQLCAGLSKIKLEELKTR